MIRRPETFVGPPPLVAGSTLFDFRMTLYPASQPQLK
jgi:hypothetical protein